MLWRPTYHRRIAQLADGITTGFSFIAAYYVYDWGRLIFPSGIWGADIKITEDIFWRIIVLAIVWVIILTKLGAYTYQRFSSLRMEIRLVGKASLFGTLTLFAADFILRFAYIPRSYGGIFFVTNFASLVIEKIILFKIAKKIREKGKDRKKVLIVGTGIRAEDFIKTVEKNLGWGLDIVGLVSNDDKERKDKLCGKKILGSSEEIENILHQYQIDEVIICASGSELSQSESILETCEREGIQVRLNSDFFGRLAKKVTVDHVYGLPIVSFTMVPNSEWSLYFKRLIDLLISGTLMIVLFPLFLIIAITLKLTSEGQLFYEWKVVGFNKRPFKSYKFRTMVVNADEIKEKLMYLNEMKGPVFKIKNDPRITGIGRVLRKYSLDELPQLWSVFKGDMSLVGPRPAGPHELARYESWHRRKLSIKPGITCLWQANGRNKIEDFDNWVKMDLWYIDNWSLWLDFKILFKTAWVVIKGTGC